MYGLIAKLIPGVIAPQSMERADNTALTISGDAYLRAFVRRACGDGQRVIKCERIDALNEKNATIGMPSTWYFVHMVSTAEHPLPAASNRQ